MTSINDEEILQHIKSRFDEGNAALNEARELMLKLQEVNTKLKESEQLKSNFLSNIRNEINNPLTSVLGLSKTIIDKENIDVDNIKAFIRQIYFEMFNLDFQLRNIFMAADLEAGEASVYITKVDVGQIIKNVIESYIKMASEKKVSIIYKGLQFNQNEYSGKFRSDPDKIFIVIANLINNAIEFCENNTQIDVEASIAKGKFICSVKNFGSVIPDGEKNNIFERFKQLDYGTTKQHKGHGIGLSVSKELIDMLGGELSFTSIKEAGTVFTVTVPETLFEDNNADFSTGENELFFDESEKF